ncbi:MAG TPA: glycine/sarcosine/betaine reductase selenoprotein B family protein [Thermoanaerobaculia bacterium]|nr:glycine/sarcosine/betaine reductase selenoprotein B family protein [Thermoanaerobaculia bacterium]
MKPDAPVDYIDVTRDAYAALGFPAYRWVHSEEPAPWAVPRRPLHESRLALIASGGIYVAGQIAFHFKDDTSFRRVPTDVPTETLRATHFAYDLTDARCDPNVVFPLDTLRLSVERGKIGALTSHAFTFMGGIYSSRRVRDELAPAIARAVADEGADAALLVPV